LAEVTALHLNREWGRLLKSGGRHHRTKAARPFSAQTVRGIARVVSSAFSRAIRWGLIATNPVSNSEPPIPKKHEGVALLPSEQELLIQSATSPWCLATLLELNAATGARRGELLALRWSDIDAGDIVIARSLTQTRLGGLEFKGTKTGAPRRVNLPESVLVPLEVHRKTQNKFHQQFGSDYRADLDLIFANPDGTPLKPDSISVAVTKLCRKLKLPKGASLHSLRHTHGSILLANGQDLPTVSKRLGHASIRTTADIYAHAMRGADQEAAKRWDDYMQRARRTLSTAGTNPQKDVQ